MRVARLAFNRGLVSKLGLARADVGRLALAAQIQTNWISRVLGSMTIRPGTGFIVATKDNLESRSIPFVFATNDTAHIELTNLKMRVLVSDALITRPSVASTIANGNFDTDLTSWTDNDEAGGTSVWVTGGYMGLTGNGTTAAIRDQSVVVGTPNIEHALRIAIQRGPVRLRVGSSSGDDDYIVETELDTGEHSLAFTPSAGNFHVRFFSRLKRQVLVDSCTVEAAGVMELTTPWTTAQLDLIDAGELNQSADII
ncbi:MAG: hypothetical protein ACREUQ_10580, partial [Burkholderiales bacterium]